MKRRTSELGVGRAVRIRRIDSVCCLLCPPGLESFCRLRRKNKKNMCHGHVQYDNHGRPPITAAFHASGLAIRALIALYTNQTFVPTPTPSQRTLPPYTTHHACQVECDLRVARTGCLASAMSRSQAKAWSRVGEARSNTVAWCGCVRLIL